MYGVLSTLMTFFATTGQGQSDRIASDSLSSDEITRIVAIARS